MNEKNYKKDKICEKIHFVDFCVGVGGQFVLFRCVATADYRMMFEDILYCFAAAVTAVLVIRKNKA